MRKGISVSPGVAAGTAYCIHEIFVNPDTQRLADSEVTAELARYETARDKTAADLRALQTKVESQAGHDEAAIFGVHESILHDAAFTNKIRNWIVSDHLTAQVALHRLLDEYTTLFSRTKDEYLKERLTDVRDVVVRLSSHLTDVLRPDFKALPGPLIVVADELLPSQVVTLGDVEVKGIVAQTGSQTSHVAIIARSRGIPAVSGVRGILRQVKTGDTIVVDGRDGHVIVNPDPETLSAYRKLEREFFHLKDELAENRDHPAVTADDVPLELLANINNLADAEAAVAMGGSGVGLFRTEYLYLTHPGVPGEEEQLTAYREIIAASPNRKVTIRTLDIGGDKALPYMDTIVEENPALGWRAIRLGLDRPGLLRGQIRALLRAASGRYLRVMFPMISQVDEFDQAKLVIERELTYLRQHGHTLPERVDVGTMVEVPALLYQMDELLTRVDFISVGSNDLFQFLFAVDRGNSRVTDRFDTLSAPILRALRDIAKKANAAGKSVSLCGEMASQPLGALALIALGYRSLSLSATAHGPVKALILDLDAKKAEAMIMPLLDAPAGSVSIRSKLMEFAEAEGLSL